MYNAGFCRERLCLMCNGRKAIKTFYNVSRVYDAAQTDDPDIEAIFLSLTHGRCDGAALPRVLDKMFSAWRKLTNHRRFVRAGFAGYFRALEVRVNPEKVGEEYHPHFHAIFLVDKRYFFEPSRYLQTHEIAALWKTSLGRAEDEHAIVDVRAVRGGGEKKYKAVAEVAKYTLKDSDYLFENDAELTAEVVEVLHAALRGRRLFAFGGLMKQIAKRLKLTDAETADLTDRDQMREEIADQLITYAWDYSAREYYKR